MARVDIIMPQMGESIAEGTLSKWLKKVGEEVKRDEPIFEISTDKVDAEIPAPARRLRSRPWSRGWRRKKARSSGKRSRHQAALVHRLRRRVPLRRPGQSRLPEHRRPPNGKLPRHQRQSVSSLPHPPSPHHTPATGIPSRIACARSPRPSYAKLPRSTE